MNKNIILSGVVGLACGLVIGFFVANSLNKNSLNNQTFAQNPNGQQLSQPMNNSPQGQPPQGGMIADVQKTLDKAANEPDNFQAQIEAGKMYLQIQRADKALEFFQKAQKIKPDDFDANSLLGNAFFDARQFENAETFYEKALSIKPNDITVQSDFATTFLQRNEPDLERAIKEFEKALSIDPKHEPSLYNLGLTYKRIGDEENVKKTFERLKEANPNGSLIQRFEQATQNK